MSNSLNKIMLLGNVGNVNEIKYATNGSPYISFSLATSESWKDKATGEKKETTEWHNCKAFGPLAEVINNYVTKGSKVYVEGPIHYRKYTTNEGIEKTSVEMTIKELKMLGKKGDGNLKSETQSSHLHPIAPSSNLNLAPAANNPSAQYVNQPSAWQSTGVFVPTAKEEPIAMPESIDDPITF